MSKIRCCFNCTERNSECHANCEKYKKEKEDYELEKAKMLKKAKIEQGVTYESITNMLRTKQKKRKQV